MNRRKTFLVSGLKEYSFCDKKMVELIGAEYEIPFSTEKTEGVHSLESCENCRNHYNLLVEELTKKFEKFPNCCDFHKKLLELDLFKKEDYKDFVNITANKILFSYHHIINNVDSEDWYNDIKDYLEYTIESYGSLPTGYGEPLELGNFYNCLLHLIDGIENKVSSEIISNIEVKTRMNKIKYLLTPIKNPEENSADLNLLLSIYNDWYKIFPFDLPYFKHLKDKFKNIIPIHTGRERTNRYSKVTKYEIHTKNSLTVTLLQITKNIISSINGATLFEKGLLNDSEKIKIDLIINNRKLELYELSKKQNKSKTEYIKILKGWFKSEKKFIAEIAPFINKIEQNSTSKHESTKTQKLEIQFNKYNFDNLEKVNNHNKTHLINKIANNSLPFQIAYLDYLGFINYLYDNYCDSFVALHKLIAEILNTTERAVRGNINGIKNEKSVDRKRYTAYQHIEKVKQHYTTLL